VLYYITERKIEQMIRCNNCMRTFKEEEDLAKVLLTMVDFKYEIREPYNPCKHLNIDEKFQEVINGCPDCLTDGYLMDI